MEVNIGDTVYFARGYKDRAREGVLVRKEGTFYVGVKPPENVNYVVGVVEPMYRQFRFPIYHLFMNFDKYEVMNCHNEQPEEVSSDFKACMPARKTIECDSIEDARKLYKALKKYHVTSVLSGKCVSNISNMDIAKKLYDIMVAPEDESGYLELDDTKNKRKLRKERDSNLHFEI